MTVALPCDATDVRFIVHLLDISDDVLAQLHFTGSLRPLSR